MPTIKQEQAAFKLKEAVETNLDITGEALLKSVGYGKGFQISPGRVFKSRGFQEALKKLGFSVEAADLTIAKILRTGKEENKIRASQEIYKRLGAYKQTEDSKNQVNIFIIPSELINKNAIRIASSPEENSIEQGEIPSS